MASIGKHWHTVLPETGFVTQKIRVEWDIGECGDIATLTDDLKLCWKGKRFIIKTGYETDGASIPKIAWSIIGSPWDEYLPAAIPHDILYNSEVLTRKEADQIFHDLMEVLTVNKIRLHLMYYAVRLLGSWRRHTKDTIENARKYLEFGDNCNSILDQ